MLRAHHPKSRFFVRVTRVVLGLGIAALACVTSSACVDAKAEYDDYRARTDTTRGVVPTQGGEHLQDGGTTCSLSQAATPPDFSGGIPDMTGTYFAECLPNLALCDVNTTLRYRGTAVKKDDGTYDFTYQPLAIASPTVATVVGTPFSSNVTLNADGSFTQTLTNILTPGSSNPFSGNDLTITTATFKGFVVDGDNYCAELDGTVTVLGSPISLDGPGDICRFRRVTSIDEKVAFSLPDFHCP